jgi:hypothetical protein
MSDKYCIIYYNPDKMNIEKSSNTIIYLKNIINIFKKLVEIITTFQELITKLSENIFSHNDNIKYNKKILFNSVKLLYDNIVILFNTKYNNNNLINISITSDIVSGYSINFVNSSIFINSYKINFSSEVGVIKFIEYDKNLEPINVSFLGTHFNKITENNFYDKLSKCFDNNLSTITLTKTISLKYINIYNNLKKILC